MLDCGARVLQTWVMWAGVTLRTRVHRSALIVVGIVLWFAAALAGTALLVVGIATGSLMLVLVAVVAPIPFALLWGRQWTAGLIAGYSFWIVVLGFAAGLGGVSAVPAGRADRAGSLTRRRPITAKGGEAEPPPSFAKR